MNNLGLTKADIKNASFIFGNYKSVSQSEVDNPFDVDVTQVIFVAQGAFSRGTNSSGANISTFTQPVSYESIVKDISFQITWDNTVTNSGVLSTTYNFEAFDNDDNSLGSVIIDTEATSTTVGKITLATPVIIKEIKVTRVGGGIIFVGGGNTTALLTGTGETIGIVPTGQDNTWEYLGIPTKFEVQRYSNSIERRTIATTIVEDLSTLNNNTINVSFSFNIPKQFKLGRWLSGLTTQTSYGNDFTVSTDGENLSLMFTDNSDETLIYENGIITSIMVNLISGLYEVDCTATFLIRKVINNFNQEIEPIIVNNFVVNGVKPKTPLTNLSAGNALLKYSTTTETTDISAFTVKQQFNIEFVKPVGLNDITSIIRLSNSKAAGVIYISDIPSVKESGFDALVRTAFGEKGAELQFEYEPSRYVLFNPVVLDSKNESFSLDEFSGLSYEFTADKTLATEVSI